jgi:hypothetical protein
MLLVCVQTFKFDRYVDAKFYKHGKEIKQSLLAFGSMCPGKKMALLEMKWYIINFLNALDMELLPGESTEVNTQFYGNEVLPPVNDVKVQYRLRENAPKIVYLPRRSEDSAS